MLFCCFVGCGVEVKIENKPLRSGESPDGEISGYLCPAHLVKVKSRISMKNRTVILRDEAENLLEALKEILNYELPCHIKDCKQCSPYQKALVTVKKIDPSFEV